MAAHAKVASDHRVAVRPAPVEAAEEGRLGETFLKSNAAQARARLSDGGDDILPMPTLRAHAFNPSLVNRASAC
jgi:hypothetical protein